MSTLLVMSLAIVGMTALAELQVWTTRLWLFLMVVLIRYPRVSRPEPVPIFFACKGKVDWDLDFGSERSGQ